MSFSSPIRAKFAERVGTERAGPIVTVLSRLGFGINIANLFVIHVVSGYIHVYAWELSIWNFINRCFSIYAASVGVSLSTFLFFEHPTSELLRR